MFLFPLFIMATPKSTKHPIHTIRPGNQLSLGIYESTLKTKDGKSRTAYSATLRKRYKKADGEWDVVYSTYPSDFLLAAHAYQEAFRWVSEKFQSTEQEIESED